MKTFVLWLTGLSGSGKTTLAKMVYNEIKERGKKIERLDGDIVRDIFPKTGFSKEERNAHVKRIGFLASILERNEVSVVASFISPYAEARNFVRNKCKNFVEVFVKASIEECEKRDVKGLYKKVRNGDITNFTGIDDPYEVPKDPEITIDTETQTKEQSLQIILKYIEEKFGKK